METSVPQPKRYAETPEFKTSFYREIEKNKLYSLILAAGIFAIIAVLIAVIGIIVTEDPETGLFAGFIGLFFAAAYIFVSYYAGDQIVLSSTGAKPLDDSTPKGRYIRNAVEGVSIAAGMLPPKIYIIDTPEMNAFATGRDPKHASIALTTGLAENLNRVELEGVIAHEISHVANYDIRFAMVVAVMIGLIAILSEVLLRSARYGSGGRGKAGGIVILALVIGVILAIFAPLLSRLVQAAISRKRELLADATAAKLTRYPDGLASALEKIGGVNKGKMDVNESISHLFFVDPTKSHLDSLYATHPPIGERVKLLRAM